MGASRSHKDADARKRPAAPTRRGSRGKPASPAKSPAPKGACLKSNNCTGVHPRSRSRNVTQTPQQYKSVAALVMNVHGMFARYGISRLGFLTLTFRGNVQSAKVAQSRFRSLRAHVLGSRYLAHIRVFERQRSGRIHYHLLVALDRDIRTGFDFTAAEQGDYSTAPDALRAERAFWRSKAIAYGFGRTEIMPIRTERDAIAHYLAKGLSEAAKHRAICDKGIRLVEYSKTARIANTRFSWLTEGGRQWRIKVAIFSSVVAKAFALERVPDLDELDQILGPRWTWYYRQFITSLATESADADLGASPWSR